MTEPTRTLWVSKNGRTLTGEDEVLQLFGFLGIMPDRVELPSQRRVPGGRHYAFAHFSTRDAAERALDAFCALYRPNSDLAPYRLNWSGNNVGAAGGGGDFSLFVRNVPSDWVDIHLERYFRTQRPDGVTAARVLERRSAGPEGETSRYGFVRFSSDSARQAAVEELQGREIAPGVTLDLEAAAPRGPRSSGRRTSRSSTRSTTPHNLPGRRNDARQPASHGSAHGSTQHVEHLRTAASAPEPGEAPHTHQAQLAPNAAPPGHMYVKYLLFVVPATPYPGQAPPGTRMGEPTLQNNAVPYVCLPDHVAGGPAPGAPQQSAPRYDDGAGPSKPRYDDGAGPSEPRSWPRHRPGSTYSDDEFEPDF